LKTNPTGGIKNIQMKLLQLFILLFSGAVLAQGPVKYELKNTSINTEESNFGVSFYGTDRVLFSQPKDGGKKWKENGQRYLDIFEATIGEGGELSDVKSFSSTVNSKYHEAGAVLSKDGNTLYFTRNDYYLKKVRKSSESGKSTQNIYIATKGTNGKFGNIKSASFNTSTYSCGLPALSNDGKTMFFASNMEGTLGDTDIFKVSINADGSFGTPENLGSVINTAEKEMFPSVDTNDNLYFSSNKAGGKGNLDVYMFDAKTNTVSAMGAPINSAGDDFSFVIDHNRKLGYVSSNREGGNGDDDIYSFSFKECVQSIEGIVTDRASGAVLANVTVVLKNIDKNTSATVTTDAVGKYSFATKCVVAYELASSLEGYAPQQLAINTNKEFDAVVTNNVQLVPNVIEVVNNEMVVKVNSIYFDSAKAIIRTDAAVELDKVVAVMKQYMDLTIEAGSHTDAKGKDEYNQKLSEKRAKATVAYIVSKGISESRISAKGYGESKLINNCGNGVDCSDEQHQLNRRTEFVIVK